MWLARKIEDGMRPTTADSYRSYIDADIVPALGAYRLSAITPAHIDTFLRELRRSGRGTATITRIRAVLRSALSDAKRMRLVAYNAATDVDVPPVGRSLVTPWEPEEAAAFLDHVAAHRLDALFELLIFTGLRRGEALALRWTDVDLERGVVTIRSNLTEVRGVPHEGSPKTRKGVRRVDIGARTVGALLAHQLAQAAEQRELGTTWNPGGRVFTSPLGTDLRPSYVTWLFRRLVAEVRFPDDAHLPDAQRRTLRRVRLHDLRHGAASLMLASGADIATVSKRLGHSQISVTADTYAHLVAGLGRRTADAAEALVPARGGNTEATAAL